MFVAWKHGGDASVGQFAPSRSATTRLARRWRRFVIERDGRAAGRASSGGYSMFSDDRTMFGDEPLGQMPAADVVQLHWVAGFVDYGAFFRWVREGRRVVWTLHDMAAFTGGCHYDAGCGKFAGECGACPALRSSDEKDLSRAVWARKRDAYSWMRPGQMHVVTPSRWLAGRARASALLGDMECSVIPYGLDLDVFRPRPKLGARAKIGIPASARVLLFVADGVRDPRKGLDHLLRAVSGLNSVHDLVVVTLGRGEPVKIANARHVHLENVSDDERLAEVYSAADVFALPSLQDNLPNTVLEAMGCGTPVAAFRTGGIPEAVRHRETGLVVETGDVGGLRTAIFELLTNEPLRAQMSARSREIAAQDYGIELQARRYAELYREILGLDNRAPRSCEDAVGAAETAVIAQARV